MFHKPYTEMIYSKLCAAPAGWFATADGRRMVAKALRIVRCLNRDDSRHLRNLLTVCMVTDRLF